MALADGLSAHDLDELMVWVVPPRAEVRRYELGDIRPVSKGTLVRLSEVADAAAAHDLVGRWLLARESDLPEAPTRDEASLGYTVRDSIRGDIGRVTERITTGANDVLVVEGGPFGQVLVPVIADVMRQVDDQNRVLHVTLLDGLIDENGGTP